MFFLLRLGIFLCFAFSFGTSVSVSGVFNPTTSFDRYIFYTLIWQAVPYLAMLGLTFINRFSNFKLTLSVGLSLPCAFGLFVYLDAFFINVWIKSDAQSGLLLLFIPLYQLIYVIVLAASLGIVAFVRRK